MNRSWRVFLLFVWGFGVCACEPVHAWDRGLLAHPAMQADARPEEMRARNHMLGAREASQGASGERGGGCGCK